MVLEWQDLCCARHFSKFSEQFHIQVFEQSQQVGGMWVYCAESGREPLDMREAVQGDFERKPAVHSSMYKNLRCVCVHVCVCVCVCVCV